MIVVILFVVIFEENRFLINFGINCRIFGFCVIFKFIEKESVMIRIVWWFKLMWEIMCMFVVVIVLNIIIVVLLSIGLGINCIKFVMLGNKLSSINMFVIK